MKCNAFTDPQTGKTVRMLSVQDIMGYAERVFLKVKCGQVKTYWPPANDDSAFQYTDMEPKDDD